MNLIYKADNLVNKTNFGRISFPNNTLNKTLNLHLDE